MAPLKEAGFGKLPFGCLRPSARTVAGTLPWEQLSVWDPKEPVQIPVEEEESAVPGNEELSALHHAR